MEGSTAVVLILGALTGAALTAGAAEQARWHLRRRKQDRALRARLERFEVGR